MTKLNDNGNTNPRTRQAIKIQAAVMQILSSLMTTELLIAVFKNDQTVHLISTSRSISSSKTIKYLWGEIDRSSMQPSSFIILLSAKTVSSRHFEYRSEPTNSKSGLEIIFLRLYDWKNACTISLIRGWHSLSFDDSNTLPMQTGQVKSFIAHTRE